MSLICLDSHILIWGIKGECKPGEERMIAQAKKFLQWLDEEKKNIIIPSIVISELLLPVPVDEHSKLLNLIQKKFIVSSFDSLAAQAFVRIWQEKKKDGSVERLKRDYKLTRSHLKVDCLIVAIAFANKVDCIYSHDEDMQKFAEGFVSVKPMQTFPIQRSFS